MNAEEFSRISIEKRIKFALDEGNEIFARLDHAILFKVYEACGFFIEVAYNTDSNTLVSADLIGEIELLKKYDDQIDLSELGI